MKKEIDKGISALVLIGLAVVWLLYLIVTQCELDWNITFGVGIAKTVMLCLTYLVLLYNAWGWSDKWLIRIVFIAITGFLIFCAVAQYIPGIEMGTIPTIRL